MEQWIGMIIRSRSGKMNVSINYNTYCVYDTSDGSGKEWIMEQWITTSNRSRCGKIKV